MPPAQAGVAAAIASTSRQIGNTLGVAIVGAAVGSSVTHAIGPAFATASHVGWWIVTALGAAVLVIGAVSTTQWALRTAEQTAERLGSDPVVRAAPAG
jgi:hypothetical protein